MYDQDFHPRFLAKAAAMHKLSILAGFTPMDRELLITADRLERNASTRRAVVHSLLQDKYLEATPMGQKGYIVTDKALDETMPEPYVGEVIIGSPAKPVATHLSAPLMKQVLIDLYAGNATVVDSTSREGSKSVISSMDARTSEEKAFGQYLYENFPAVVCKVTNMSEAVAVHLRLPFGNLDTKHIGGLMAEIYEQNLSEIQRLKRLNDAMMALHAHAETMGGWAGFIEEARGLYESERSQN
jgi:hypothetical protein